MAEILIPFRHTVMIPQGSPGIGAVNEVRMELRSMTFGSGSGHIRCHGVGDVLVDYTAAGESENPFAMMMAKKHAGMPWQFLTTVTLDLLQPGDLPKGDVSCRLHACRGYKVALSGLELEGELLLETAEAEPEQAFVERPVRETAKMGGWSMVSLDDKKQEEILQRLVDEAEETVASAEKLWQRIDEEQEDAEADREQPIHPVDTDYDYAKYAEETPQVNTVFEKTPPEPIRIQLEFEKPATVADVTFPAVEQDDPEPVMIPEPVVEEPVIETMTPAEAAEVVAEPVKKKAKKKRRVTGLPCLVVDAKDNNVEISAFNLQIKL